MSMKEEYTAIDMATAAAEGFRDGQRAAQSAHHNLLGELYQVLGALDAPDNVLDNVSAAIHDEPLPHATLLPFVVSAQSAPVVPEGWRVMLERLADTAEQLNDCMRDMIDEDMEDPDMERELCDETDELVQEARAMLAAPAQPAAHDQGEVQRLREALEHCSEVMKDPWKHGEGCISRAINRADAALAASTGKEV